MFEFSVQLTSGVTKVHAVEYAVVEGFRPLQLDLYLPPATGLVDTQSPAILFIHGGGWAVGSRRRFGRAFAAWEQSPLELLAAAGFVVAAVDYRLSGEAAFPAQLHDCTAAIRWLRANADSLHIDVDRVVSWGESAGGHLSLMVGLTGNRADMHGTVGEHLDQRSDVCGVVDWYGVTDLLSAASQRHPSSTVDQDSAASFESRLLSAPVQTVPDAARFASPITYVHGDAPPVQIHHGDADLMVPYEQSNALVAALEDAEVSVEFVTLPGADHFWIGAPDIAAIFNASLAFAKHVTAAV
jgi:acetyl esterase/lipase